MPDFGIDYFDFGARQYSSTLSRWLVPDSMGEKYFDVSPYVYCAGNPVNLIDLDGNAANPVYDFDGNFLGTTIEGFTGTVIIYLGKKFLEYDCS